MMMMITKVFYDDDDDDDFEVQVQVQYRNSDPLLNLISLLELPVH